MSEAVVDILAYMVLALDITVIGYLSVKFLEKFVDLPFSGKISEFNSFLEDYYRELGFVITAVATAGSLYLSNFMGWTPCRLCWFQRIFMYPIALILLVSIFLDRENVEEYVLPLSMTGAMISLYHYAVQRVSQFHSAGCSIMEVSCETQHTFYFGYINIPMMALTAFVATTVLMYLGWKKI